MRSFQYDKYRQHPEGHRGPLWLHLHVTLHRSTGACLRLNLKTQERLQEEGEIITPPALYNNSSKKRSSDKLLAEDKKVELERATGNIRPTAPKQDSTARSRKRHEDYLNNTDFPANRKKKKLPKEGDIFVMSLTRGNVSATLITLPLLTTDLQPCAPFYCQGTSCMHAKENCKLDHTPMKNLCLTSKQEWFDFVSKTSDAPTGTRIQFARRVSHLFTSLDGAPKRPE